MLNKLGLNDGIAYKRKKDHAQTLKNYIRLS